MAREGRLVLVDPHRLFELFAAHRPAPASELVYDSPYTLLVAVLLSAQTTDQSVNRATRVLFEVAKTPQQMVALGQEQLETYLRSLNYYRTKVRHVLAASQRLIEHHQGKVPDQFEALIQLPGVGRKTANVILNIAFNQPTIAVDTHVGRVSRRLGLTDAEKPEAIEADLLGIVPEAYRLYAHHWLILHGRYQCKARKPVCETCFLTDICRFYKSSAEPAAGASGTGAPGTGAPGRKIPKKPGKMEKTKTSRQSRPYPCRG